MKRTKKIFFGAVAGMLVFIPAVRAQLISSEGAESISQGGATGFGAAVLFFMNLAGFNTDISAKGIVFSPISSLILSFFTFLGVIFLGLMVYAGFRWMTAGGNEDIVDKSRKIIRDSMIGLLIVLASFFVVYFIMGVATIFSSINSGCGEATWSSAGKALLAIFTLGFFGDLNWCQ